MCGFLCGSEVLRWRRGVGGEDSGLSLDEVMGHAAHVRVGLNLEGGDVERPPGFWFELLFID